MGDENIELQNSELVSEPVKKTFLKENMIKQKTKNDSIENECDLDLSEEFISTILTQVDDLCEIINNGDPNLERTIEVNQNLNNAVNCYREKLIEKVQSN